MVHILFIHHHFNIKSMLLEHKIQGKQSQVLSLILIHQCLAFLKPNLVCQWTTQQRSFPWFCSPETEQHIPYLFFPKYNFCRVSMGLGTTQLRGWLTCPRRHPQKEWERQMFSFFSVSLILSHSQATNCNPSLPLCVLGRNFSRQI